jgi:hypothetical protein
MPLEKINLNVNAAVHELLQRVNTAIAAGIVHEPTNKAIKAMKFLTSIGFELEEKIEALG